MVVSTSDVPPEPPAAPAEAAPATTAAEKPAPPAERPRPTRAPAREPKGKAGGRRSLLETAREEPAVDKLLREFGAQVVDIQPLAPGGGSAPPPDDGPLKETP